ncbi:MAG: hypothetical protein HYX60_06830 [Legionella longbeachae]|nr:hypothetical protein [Legionella longbeachae]
MPDNLPYEKNDDKKTQSQEKLIIDSQSSSSSSQEYLWMALGKGSYNTVWKSNFSTPIPLVPNEPYKGPWVLKYPIFSNVDKISNLMNDKERAVRVWNEINEHLPKAGLYKSGWVAPFFENTRQATDAEVVLKLIDIYCATRRIILDAATLGNFLTNLDSGEVILVDVDLAIRRSSSLTSMQFAKNLDQRFDAYWNESSLKQTMPKTFEITKNLLYLEDYLSPFEINELCKNQKINLKNIQPLTWLRTHNKKLTCPLLQNIALLNESEINVSDLLLEALSLEPQKENKVNNSPKFGFFSEISKKESSIVKNTDHHQCC